MFGACVAMFVLAIFYEGIKAYRQFLFQNKPKCPTLPTSSPVSDRVTLSSGQHCPPQADPETLETGSNSLVKSLLATSHLIQTLLHIVQVTVSYVLMLAVMTFNVWLIIAIVLGAGVGYFFFGWRPAAEQTEHCY